MPARKLLIGAAVVALAVPVLAQESLLPPGFGNTPAPAPSSTPPSEPRPSSQSPARPTRSESVGEIASTELPLTEVALANMPPPVELPNHARRDPFEVGAFDPAGVGLGAAAWGGASGRFLSNLLRRMDRPAGSRWAHMAVRNALLVTARAPVGVNPADWTAERAWLLLRMGEADGARMLISGVDVDRFTPKMFQVAVQSSLANSDPSGLCPLESGIAKVEPGVYPLIQAMCAALAGEPESAASQIDAARRRGRIGGIDLALAQKVVGGASDTSRAVTIEWDPVERLNVWRFGLASATGMTPPQRLIDGTSPQVRAWFARSPMIAPAVRLDSARLATGMGIFSSQALVDIYSQVYDSTDPNDLADSDAWQLRQAFVGRDQDARLAAFRRLLGKANNPVERKATYALLARAATRIVPSADLQNDAPNLIAAMLAGGFDREAARWLQVVDDMDDEYADPSWAMLVVSAPQNVSVDVSQSRIASFVDRDESENKSRSALLVGALTGLRRIDEASAGQLNGRFGLRLQRLSRWTGMIDGAAARGQGGTVAILTGLSFRSPTVNALPPSHMFHAVAGLRRTGQEFVARMIAAEALSPSG